MIKIKSQVRYMYPKQCGIKFQGFKNVPTQIWTGINKLINTLEMH